MSDTGDGKKFSLGRQSSQQATQVSMVKAFHLRDFGSELRLSDDCVPLLSGRRPSGTCNELRNKQLAAHLGLQIWQSICSREY